MDERPIMPPPPELEIALAGVCKSLSPVEVWLFGSRARGNARPDSDWDLLAVVEDSAPEALTDPVLAWEISRDAVVPMTLLVTRRADLRSIWGMPNTLGYELSLDGIRLRVG